MSHLPPLQVSGTVRVSVPLNNAHARPVRYASAYEGFPSIHHQGGSGRNSARVAPEQRQHGSRAPVHIIYEDAPVKGLETQPQGDGHSHRECEPTTGNRKDGGDNNRARTRSVSNEHGLHAGGYQISGHGTIVEDQHDTPEAEYILYKSKTRDALRMLKRIGEGYRRLLFYTVGLGIYIWIMHHQLGLMEISRFSSSARAMCTGKGRGFVMITGEHMDPPFYNKAVYDTRSFWRWWERFLVNQVFKDDPVLIRPRGSSQDKNVTRVNNFNDLVGAAVMTVQIGNERKATQRGYYEHLESYSRDLMSDPPSLLPGVAGSIDKLSGEKNPEISYSEIMNGYPIFFWNAPASKGFYKALEALEENRAEYLESNGTSHYLSKADFALPSDTIVQCMESKVVNNRTRIIQIRIPQFNPQLDVVGVSGWDIHLDLAGYWAFEYHQHAFRRDPYDVETTDHVVIREVLEIGMLIVGLGKMIQLLVEMTGLQKRFQLRTLRRLLPTGRNHDATTALLSLIACAAQVIVWIVIVMKGHASLRESMTYIEEGKNDAVLDLLKSLEELDGMYRAYLWCSLCVFGCILVHVFNVLKFQGKLNAISMVVSDTLAEVLWFFLVFLLAVLVFTGIFMLYFGTYLTYMDTFQEAFFRTFMMAFSMSKMPDKELWATGNPTFAKILVLLFRIVMIVFLLKMVFAIVNTQYKKNRKAVHNKANSPWQDFQQMWASWYLAHKQRKNPSYVSSRVVLLALDTCVLDKVEEVSVEQLFEALQEVEQYETFETPMTVGHAEWVIAFFSIEKEGRLTEATKKKVSDLIKELKETDAKTIKKIEKNIDFLVAAIEVKLEKTEKDGKGKKDKESSNEPAHSPSSNSSPQQGKMSQPDSPDSAILKKSPSGIQSPTLRNMLEVTTAALKKEAGRDKSVKLVGEALDPVDGTWRKVKRRVTKSKTATSSHEDDKPESDLQKMRKRWAFMANMDF